jgi:hypothetical protein
MYEERVFTATIASGASLSGAITSRNVTLNTTITPLGSLTVVAIIMPSAWTAANLTFQSSNDGTTFNDIYDSYGNELVVSAAASRYIIMPPTTFLTGFSLKVRSGTTATPVNQGAARAIILRCRYFS